MVTCGVGFLRLDLVVRGGGQRVGLLQISLQRLSSAVRTFSDGLCCPLVGLAGQLVVVVKVGLFRVLPTNLTLIGIYFAGLLQCSGRPGEVSPWPRKGADSVAMVEKGDAQLLWHKNGSTFRNSGPSKALSFYGRSTHDEVSKWTAITVSFSGVLLEWATGCVEVVTPAYQRRTAAYLYCAFRWPENTEVYLILEIRPNKTLHTKKQVYVNMKRAEVRYTL